MNHPFSRKTERTKIVFLICEKSSEEVPSHDACRNRRAVLLASTYSGVSLAPHCSQIRERKLQNWARYAKWRWCLLRKAKKWTAFSQTKPVVQHTSGKRFWKTFVKVALCTKGMAGQIFTDKPVLPIEGSKENLVCLESKNSSLARDTANLAENKQGFIHGWALHRGITTILF